MTCPPGRAGGRSCRTDGTVYAPIMDQFTTDIQVYLHFVPHPSVQVNVVQVI